MTDKQTSKPKSSGRPVFTNIDRSKCHRTVPMKVLVLGMSRTGTSSMKAALEILGYKEVYHMISILAGNPRDADIWRRAYDAIYGGKGTFDKNDWDALLGHCMAVADQPAIDFSYELIETYPDAKVILLTRDIDAWCESYMDTVGRTFINYHNRYHKWYSPQRYLIPKWHVGTLFDCFFKYIGQEWYPQRAKQQYMDQTARVRYLMDGKPKEQYLEFNVKQGWKPLCRFLGKEVPQDKDFPRVMERMEYYETSGKVRMYEIVLMAVNLVKMAVLAAVLVGGLWWWMSRE